MSQLIGRVFATESSPNTPDTFNFWTELNSPVGIGTIVKVSVPQPSRRNFGNVNATEWDTYGIVVEAHGYTDLASALHDYIGADQSPQLADDAPTIRPEIRAYKAAVLRMEPEEPLQPVPIGSVYLADDESVIMSLRMDEYYKKRGIPVGVYVKGGMNSPVYLDADFLLGPEAAHLNITGVSGLATKTSLVEFLLKSIFAHYYPNDPSKSVAAVFFNVKGPDLLYLDLPPTDSGKLTDEELAIYDKLGIPATPFANVQYYAPYKPDGYNLNTLRTHPDLMHNVSVLQWGLREIFEYAEVLLNRDDVDAKADAVLALIEEKVIRTKDPNYTLGIKVTNFQRLEEWFRTVIEEMEAENKKEWHSHHIATIYKVRNRLMNITNRCKGLVGNGDNVSDLPWGEFKKNHVYVIDVANLEQTAQDLVFTRTVSKIRESLEQNNLGVERVVIFVDELNKYASSDGQDSYLKRTLLDISERGRYLGEVLFSAQQFRSQVHKRIVGNCGTGLYGRMDMDELATPGYGTLSSAVKTKLATLPKGELMVRHPHFTQPVFLKFPRPPVMRGQDGRNLYQPQTDMPFAEAMVWRLRQLDRNLSAVKIKDAIADFDQETVMAKINQLEQQKPEDILAWLKSNLQKIQTRKNGHQVKVAPVFEIDDDDPYKD
ncbi:hypothetical protein Syn7502_01057 [Synechococcus sp. PCC 7502]|uniref:ATP-binding protein n=1 Tax=Synechococcus sp. PCC 7502 TaxID=1173263 RepID=UPI00029F9DDA|nr:ATP-binding protein [Synechococcus sp. PCC 7502]AFY73167.1 hypothetical protein Syn7502_01057 [Synechococcus sp. PCC 7502]